MSDGMPLPEYLRIVAERIEAADGAKRPAEVIRLCEVLRDALAAQVKKRVAALALLETKQT